MGHVALTPPSAPSPVSPAETRPVAPSRRHVPALDGIRGIAILMVIWFHTIGELAVRHPLDEIVARVARSSWTGVDLFFTLSGFLITSILLDTRGRRGYFRNFMMRRALRIIPPYAVLVVLILWVLPASGLITPQSVAEPRKHLLWFVAMLPNFLVGLHGFRAGADLDHLWSIGVEEQFYLVWPLVVALVAPPRLRRVTLALVVIAPLIRLAALAAGATPRMVYTLTPLHYGGLAMGALIAVSLRTDVPPALLRRRLATAAAVGAVALAPIFVFRGGLLPFDAAMQRLGYFAVVMLCGCLVAHTATAAPDSATARWIGSAPLRFFGKYSYALYLFHPIIVTLIVKSGWSDASLRPIGGMLLPAAMVRAAVVLALAVLVALASWHLVERPALSLKRYFPD